LREEKDFRLLAKELQILNRHLAVAKRDLESLFREERPRIPLRDGSTHTLRKEELERIRETLPEAYHRRLLLPIYIELASDKYGAGTARISGQAEALLISRLLGKDEPEGDELFLYKPEIRALRKLLPTTTQYLFSLALE
jgi:hypothetical protein